MEAHVSLRVRRTLILAAIAVAATLLFAISSQRADAKAKHSSAVTKGPKGLKFYKPPKSIPGRHGTLIWARNATGVVKLAGRPVHEARALLLAHAAGRRRRRSRASVSVPKGKPPKGGWPVITWAHGTTGVADICAPSRDGLDPSANTGETYINRRPERLAAGRLCGPAHRLPGPRHARQAPVPDRRHRRAAASSTSSRPRASSTPTSAKRYPDRRPLAGRTVPRCSRLG